LADGRLVVVHALVPPKQIKVRTGQLTGANQCTEAPKHI
jgi:hypothetical protein